MALRLRSLLLSQHSAALFAVIICVTAACSKSRNGRGSISPVPPIQPTKPTQEKPVKHGRVVIPSGKLPLPDKNEQQLTLPGGGIIRLQKVAGVTYLQVNAILEDAAFKSIAASARALSPNEHERVARLQADLDATIGVLKKSASLLRVKTFPQYGFFTALMPLAVYENMPAIDNLPHTILMNPAVHVPLDERHVRVMSQEAMAGVDPRLATDAFSGLKRMGVPEFLEQVQAELGEARSVDGRRVLVGVTDTGVTLNHPAFQDASGESRIIYMRDFTGEGRIYFNPGARFEVSVPTADELPNGTSSAEALLLSAQVLAPQKGVALPVADKLTDIQGILLVNADLKAQLMAENSGAKLGFLSEAAFTSTDEKVDLNQNGTIDDNLAVILLPTATGAFKLYFSATGTLDFRRTTAVGNWNTSKQVVKLGSEKFGFDIITTNLQDTAGTDVEVVAASIVGFDPGNHGSHVSGIIAGRKTIANDADTTLARGAAPNAKFMLDRVCANNGGCNYTEAVIDLAEAGAEIINLSIGGLSPFNDGYDTDEILMDRLTELRNTLFVISAGNSGPGINTVGSPSTGRHAISVAATATRALIERQYQWPAKGKPGPLTGADENFDDDFLLFFSSRGPSAAGGFKPDIAAPGTELSAIQLNAAPGAPAGLAVFWGTSMAAPSATGAIALLLDAAKRYNELNPNQKLPIDALTLRKVVVGSARPFDVTRLDTTTGEFTRGQYTWIDQGFGMIHLPRAWAALKAERDQHVASAVTIESEGTSTEVALDYQVRVLRTSANGINYDGSIELSPEALAITGPRFGRGIWLDARQNDSLIPVQIARRLPASAAGREDAGDLRRQLLTTRDEFVLRTVIYGSNTPWVKAGVLNQLNCQTAPESRLSVLGEGAVDDFASTTGPRSIAEDDSRLNVCVDRTALNALPPGDHGALILAYKTREGRTEANPSFVVPVYVTLPHKTLAAAAGFAATGVVQSFAVDRHYVDVPEGVSMVTVRLEVPEAQVSGPRRSVVRGCMGARLYAYEAGNTLTPEEISTTPASLARNCNEAGQPTSDKRIVTYSRTNPKAGIWNLLVFGRYEFAESDYQISVEYAKVNVTPGEIVGTPSALTGSIQFDVLDSSFAAEPSAEKSSLLLNGLRQTQNLVVAEGDLMLATDAAGEGARRYGADVTAVTIKTDGSAGNDLDLYVHECEDAALEVCHEVGASTGSTDLEKVTFVPVADRYYAAYINGFSVTQNEGKFQLTELRTFAAPEVGTVAVSANGESRFTLMHAFNIEASLLLANSMFLSGQYDISGSLEIRTATGALMTQIPVLIEREESETH